jgi:hypothetical protein
VVRERIAGKIASAEEHVEEYIAQR